MFRRRTKDGGWRSMPRVARINRFVWTLPRKRENSFLMKMAILYVLARPAQFAVTWFKWNRHILRFVFFDGWSLVMREEETFDAVFYIGEQRTPLEIFVCAWSYVRYDSALIRTRVFCAPPFMRESFAQVFKRRTGSNFNCSISITYRFTEYFLIHRFCQFNGRTEFVVRRVVPFSLQIIQPWLWESSYAPRSTSELGSLWRSICTGKWFLSGRRWIWTTHRAFVINNSVITRRILRAFLRASFHQWKESLRGIVD